METRASYALVGASIIAGVIAFVGFILWLGQVQFNRSYAEYDVVFVGAVNGLSEGGQVRYLGINVGEVTDLHLDRTQPDRVIAQIRIDAATPVREDSKAALDFAGLTGVTFIQIKPGEASSPLLPKRTGNNRPTIDTEKTQLAELFSSGANVLSDAQITVNRINELLDEENRESLKSILKNIETISGAFAEDEELITSAKDAMAALTGAGEAVGNAANSFNTLGTDAQASLGEITESAKTLFADASQTIQRAEAAIGQSEAALRETREAIQNPTVEAIEEIQLLAQDLRLLVRRLDRVATDIEQNPQTLIQGSPKPYRDR